MKKAFFITFVSIFMSVLNGIAQDIECIRTGKYISISIHETDNMSINHLLDEFDKVIAIANDNKCKSIMIKDKDGNTWDVYVSHTKMWDTTYSKKLLDTILAMKSTDTIYGKIIGTENVYRYEQAMYISETYVDGKLESTYSSEWTGDPFPSKTSTYTSSGSTWRTKTYYQPARQVYVGQKNIYESVKYVDVDGFTNFVKKVIIPRH